MPFRPSCVIWVIFAALTAFFRSLEDVFAKHALARADEYLIAWSSKLIALLFLLPALWLAGIPSISSGYWPALLVSGSLNAAAALLYMRALKSSDLSVTAPMLTFTPLFLLVTSPLMLHEVPDASGLLGVLCIVLGSYLLHGGKGGGLLAPFRSLLRERGPRLMLLVALIWSVSSNVDKMGLRNSSPIFWAISLDAFMVITLLPFAIRRLPQARGAGLSLLLVGVFAGLTVLHHMIALSMTLVAYLIAIKRTSALLSVLWGWLIFREKGMRTRLPGAALMVLGVLLITL